MAFFKINGIEVPISERGTRRVPAPIQQQGRAQDGTAHRTRQALKYRYLFTTGLLSHSEAAAVRGLIQGEGESWSFHTDRYSVKGAAFRGTPEDTTLDGGFVDPLEDGVFQPEFTNGPDVLDTAGTASSTPNGTWTGDGRQNVSDVIDTDGDSGNWTVSGAEATVVGTSSPTYIGSASVIVSIDGDEFTLITPTTVTAERNVYTATLATASGDTPLVCSFYVNGQASTNGLQLWAHLSDSDGNTVDQIITLYENRWKRYELTYDVPDGTDPEDVTLTFSNKDDGAANTISDNTGADRNFAVDGIQLEYGRSVATELISNGTAFDEVHGGAYLETLSGAPGATFSFWWKAPSTYPAAGTLFWFGDAVGTWATTGPASADWGATVTIESDGDLVLTVKDRDDPAGGTDETVTATDPLGDDWSMVTLVVTDRSSTDGLSYKVYVNGGLQGMILPANNYAPAFDTNLNRMIFMYAGLGDGEAHLSDLQILPYAAPGWMVDQMYASNVQQGLQPKLAISGSCEERARVECLGKVAGEEYVSVRLPGCNEFSKNAVRMNIELTEI